MGAVDVDVEKRIAVQAAAQEGHLTREQLARAGLHPSTVLRRTRGGLLVPVGSRTFRLASVPPSPRGHVVAATLDTGGVASHWTAAWLHGIAAHRPVIDVTVTRRGAKNPRQVRRVGESHVRVHSSTSLPADDILTLGPIPVTSVARTVLGLGALQAELGPRDLFDIVSRAVDLGVASDPWLWWLLARRRCRGRGGVLAMESVLAERARLGPTESWLEREDLRLLERAGLPLPRTQRVVRRRGRFAARVDFLYEPERIVVEVLGYAFHRTERQLADDLARANELQLLGFDVYQFVTRQIVCTPSFLPTTIAQALSLAGSADVAA